jgi:hypothetical protein
MHPTSVRGKRSVHASPAIVLKYHKGSTYFRWNAYMVVRQSLKVYVGYCR